MSKYVDTYICLALIAVITISCVGINFNQPQNQIKKQETTFMTAPTLHVDGNQIKDVSGNIILLKGWNKNGFEDYPEGSWQDISGAYSYGVFDDDVVTDNLVAMKAYGANCIRISSDSMYALNPTDLAYITQLASLASAQNMYVIYTLRQNNNTESQPNVLYNDLGNGYIADAAAFTAMWVGIANTLKSCNNIIFELQNEPLDYLATWAPIWQNTINAVRATGASNLIIVQYDMGVYWDYAPGGGHSNMDWVSTCNFTDSTGNLVYSTHVYLNGNFYSSALGYADDYDTSDFLYACQQLGIFVTAASYPVVIGEIGENLNDVSHAAAQLAWYEYAVDLFLSNGIGVLNWWWYPSGSGTGYDSLTGDANYALNSVGAATSTIFLSYPDSSAPPTTYNLTVSAGAHGSVVPAVGVHSYTDGDTATITASANLNYTFTDWIIDSVEGNTTNPLTVTMSVDHSVQPVFTLTVTPTPPPTPPPTILSLAPTAYFLFDPSIFDPEIFDMHTLTLLETLLMKAEQQSIGHYLGVPGLFECGMDNFDCPMRHALKHLEKQK